jgi:hypothetical protein
MFSHLLRTLLPHLLLALALFSAGAHAEDIPLDTCDRLPVIEVTISGTESLNAQSREVQSKMRFLVDTAATSMLNSKSFPQGDASSTSVTSWSGTVKTQSRQITIHQFTIGQHSLKELRLPAIDLSAIGRACGKRIDGILGVDLLSQFGMTVDVKNHTAQLRPDAKSAEDLVAEMHAQLSGCEDAFNRADEAAFAECLDPQVVIFTVGGDFYGRERAMEYYRTKYFQHTPRAHITITHHAHHLIGDAIWWEYDLKIVIGSEVVQARGTALCRKNEGRWRIVHMNHSNPPAIALEAQKTDK